MKYNGIISEIIINSEVYDEPVMVEDAKSFLRISNDTEDALISSLIKAAREKLEKEIGSTYKEGEGVFVTGVPEGGAANTAGLKKGDIVTKLNGVAVSGGPELQEQVSRYKPGDKITLTYVRNGKENTANITLKNRAGNTDVVKNAGILQKLGAELVNVDAKTATANQIPGGVVVKRIGDGLLKKTRMQDGFIITSVDNQEIKTVADLDRILSQNKGRKIKIEGIYPGYENTYPYPLDLSDVE